VKVCQSFLLPSREKVGGGAARMRGLVQQFPMFDSRTMSGSPLIRLASRATFSLKGRRKT